MPYRLVASLITLSVLSASPAQADTVFDSITGFETGGGYACCAHAGQTVTLAGMSRTVKQIELTLGTGGPSTYFVEFYNLDGPSGVPGTRFWQSGVQTYPYVPPFYNRTPVKVAVPDVLVPDTFAWIVTSVQSDNDTMFNTAPPTIGSIGSGWTNPTGNQWIQFSYFRLGARITAIPEPGCGTLLIIGALLAGGRHRRLECR